MLKQAKELNIDIVSVEDYIELMGKPNDTFGEDDQTLLYRLIKQATTQFDSLVSGAGNVGFLYQWWNDLKDNDIDNSKGYRLQKAICSWVETMVQNGKFWIEGVPNLSSNIDYDIASSSKNSNIELKRKDIIQDLVAIGLTATTNIASNSNQQNINPQDFDEYLVYSKNYLNENFVSLNSMGENQTMRSGINMGECPITNGGDIWNTNPNKHKIINYKLQGCEISLKDNEILDNDGYDITNMLSEAKGQDIIFESEQAFEEFKQANKIDDSYFANSSLDLNLDTTNFAKLNESNTFQEKNTFNKGFDLVDENATNITHPVSFYTTIPDNQTQTVACVNNNVLDWNTYNNLTSDVIINKFMLGLVLNTDYAKLNKENTFTKSQTIEGNNRLTFATNKTLSQYICMMNGVLGVSNRLSLLQQTDTVGSAIATKQYVDYKVDNKVEKKNIYNFENRTPYKVGEININGDVYDVVRQCFHSLYTITPIEDIVLDTNVGMIVNYCITTNISFKGNGDNVWKPLPMYWSGSSDHVYLTLRDNFDLVIERQWTDRYGPRQFHGWVEYIKKAGA